MSEINQLQERWKTEEGNRIMQSVLTQRFDLTHQEKVELSSDGLITDLRGIDLSGRELKGYLVGDTDFRWANLKNCSLTDPLFEANFSFVDFSNSFLKHCDIWDTKVKSANFEGATLQKLLFVNADARNASFRNAKLESVEFQYTDLRGASFDGTVFENCRFFRVKLDMKNKEIWEKFNEKQCVLKFVEWCEP
ncbi:pentapeptide repeat-containing protein [Undibacterium sp. JH2W]|uniref:pentapeptide repeat-containing protein n=1 Tax=Undibacterium sp. JH2W TaxID=3413037 RepID=UPI003BF37677